MTNQSKPDQPETLLDIVESCTYAHAKGAGRQGGDVEAGTILQIGGASPGQGWGMNAIEVREATDAIGWRWRTITNEEKQRLIDALNSVSPTRDAAEGAGDFKSGVESDVEGKSTKGTYSTAAPQKPAPDAMREAMKVTGHDRDLAKNLLADLGDDGIEDSEIVAQWFRKVRVETLREYSAPAPPADGAIPLTEALIRLQRRLMSYCNHANAGHMPADAREFARRIILGFASAYEEAGIASPVIDPETDAEYLVALPSGTGAAEPVAWRWKNTASTKSIWSYTENRMEEHPLLTLKVEPLYATPSVRGDWEPWRERWFGSEPQRGWSIMQGRDVVAYIGGDETMSQAVTTIVTAHNAALPVQPGAGEMEAFIASIRTRVGQIEKARKNATADSGFQIETACSKLLQSANDFERSRQAPHSSREGGR